MSVLNAQLLYGSSMVQAMSLELAVGSLSAHSLVNMDLVAAVGRQRHREKELATPLHKSDDSGELFSLIDTPLLQYCTRDLYLYSKVIFFVLSQICIDSDNRWIEECSKFQL